MADSWSPSLLYYIIFIMRLSSVGKVELRTRPSGHGELRSSAEGFSCLTFSYPVLPAEGNKHDKDAVLSEISSKYDGNAMAASAMADQPSIERWRQSNAGQRVARDVGDKAVHLIKSSSGCVEIPTGDFDDVIN